MSDEKKNKITVLDAKQGNVTLSLDGIEAIRNISEEVKKICEKNTEGFQRLAEVGKIVSEVGRKVFETFRNIVSTINGLDINEAYMSLMEEVVIEHNEIIQEFTSNTIFPPIMFINSKDGDIIAYQNLIEYKEINEFYSENILMWKREEYPSYINKIIDEIHFNFENNNIYAVIFPLFTLLEYRLNIAPQTRVKKNRNGSVAIYPTYKNILEDSVFYREHIKRDLFNYVNEVIFKNTEEATSLTRHVVHGHRLDLITYDSMMSIIFLYDFIDNILKIDRENFEKHSSH